MSQQFPNDDTAPDELIAAWGDAIEEFTAVADTLDADEWVTPSRLDGWSVGDIVAHIAHLDGLLLGVPQVDHVPDWSVRTHVKTPFQQLTEYGVDVRRSRSQQEVIDELHEMVNRRREQLLEPDTDSIVHFIGLELSFARVMRRRTLDVWVHLMDICFALGRPYPPQDGPAPRVTAGLWLEGLPRVLAKDAAAPVGTVLRLIVDGPDVEFDVTMAVDTGGRGMYAASTEVADAIITMSWLHFVALAGGRVPRELIDLQISGDEALAESYLTAMTLTP